MDNDTTRYIVRDELKQFMLERCRLNQANTVKDTRIMIYTFLVIIILLSIVLIWWLNWVPENYWWGKVGMTFAFVGILIWLGVNYNGMK